MGICAKEGKMTIGTTIFSILGNNASIIPLGIKDVSNALGQTTGSYLAGDKIEGKDRFIDEFGTQAIWIGGIPIYKKIIDLTLYKLAGFNSKINVRVLKDPQILKKAAEHAPEHLKAGFEKLLKNEKNQKIFKRLFSARFIASTALTLISYNALTYFRHKSTEKAVLAEIKREEELKKINQKFIDDKNKKSLNKFSLSFKGGIQDFMFNPVKNMMIIDGGISSQRLASSRNPQDFIGYTIKEGAFWFFMYFAGEKIQKLFEDKAAKKHTPIDLDIRALQNKNLKTLFENLEIESKLKEFSIKGSDAKIYESLFNNDNIVVETAKKSGIIKTIKETGEINTGHYIDIEEIKGVHKKLGKLLEGFNEFKAKGLGNVDEYFKEIVKLKRLSILKNIGTCIGFLGIIVPGTMLAVRLLRKDKEFQVKKEIKEQVLNKKG